MSAGGMVEVSTILSCRSLTAFITASSEKTDASRKLTPAPFLVSVTLPTSKAEARFLRSAMSMRLRSGSAGAPYTSVSSPMSSLRAASESTSAMRL